LVSCNSTPADWAARHAAWHGRRAAASAPGADGRQAADGVRRASAIALGLGQEALSWKEVLRWRKDCAFKGFSDFVKRHSQVIGFGGYVLITIQWCMDDVLLLRCFGIVCATSMAIFAYFQPTPLMVPVRFNMLFICINGLFIARILVERRDLKLDPTEQALWDLGFGAFLTKVQLRELVCISQRQEVPASAVLAESGAPIQRRVVLILAGGMVQTRNGTTVSAYEPGDFWGEFQLLEKSRHLWDQHKVTSAFSCKSTILEWDADKLDEYLTRRPVIRQRLQEIWAEGLTRKLERNNLKANERAYADILRGILCAGVVGEAELTFLKHVREVQNIPERVHADALQQLGYTEADFAQLVRRSRPSWWSRWVGGQATRTFPSRLAFKQEHGRSMQHDSRLQWPVMPAFRKTPSSPHVSGRWETGWSDSPCPTPKRRCSDALLHGLGAPPSPSASQMGGHGGAKDLGSLGTAWGRRATC